MEPLFAIIFASLLLGERKTALQLLGCAMIIGGAARCILEGKKA
ncbi:MAG: EamA family transporter [Synergistaceae bacterium]|nr:EamA family transporter [Synergistaceae bacterium]MDO4952532.1 EamA family transporter [Synergistaceae bacterium]